MKANWIRRVRAVGGLISIVALVSMVFIDFLLPNLVLQDQSVFILSVIISALLGVDIFVSNKAKLARALIAGIEALAKNGRDNNE